VDLPADAFVEPWFRRYPGLAVAAALVLIAGITVLRFSAGDETDAAGLLYALPVALLAIAFGLRAGLLAALACLALLVAWVGTTDGAFTPLGWFARVVPLLLLGVLIGRASDGLREAARVATRLAVAQARQRDAAEVNDTIVQHLSAAKWMFERGANDDGITEVEVAITAGQSLVSELLTGLDDARHARPTDGHRAPTRAGGCS
jgi:hypothetical protein